MRSMLAAVLALSLALPCRAAEKTKPNSLTPKEVTDGWLLLFDGETTFGWKLDGEAKVNDGVLLLGGEKPTTANMTMGFSSDFDLHFEYFPEKSEKDVLMKLGETTAHLSGFTGWHSVTAQARYDTKTKKNSLSVKSQLDRGVTSGLSVAGKDIEINNCDIIVPAKAQLMLRNIKLKPLGLKPIFNSKDLTAWKEFPDRKSKFTVTKEGWLSIKNGPGDLQTTGQWADFLLQLECRTNGDNLNSGVFFRCQPDKYQQGYEVQIQNQHARSPKAYTVDEYDPQSHKLKDKQKIENWSQDYGTGAIYRRVPARRAVTKDREWFTMTVAAHGRQTHRHLGQRHSSCGLDG